MAQTEIAPGLTLGPLNPDNASELTGRVGVHNKANALLERHAANFPQKLLTALSLPFDDDRSETLDLDEVESALRALSGRRAFFKPDDVLEGASVRGTSDRNRVVSVVFRKPGPDGEEGSGRSAQGVIPYAGMSKSIAAYEEKIEADRASSPGGLAQLLAGRQVQADPAESQADPELVARLEKLEADSRQAVDDAKKADERATAAENERRAAEQRAQEAEERAAAVEDPEPFAGYAEMTAKARVEKLKDGGIEEYGRSGLERIRTYEEGHDKFATVLDAIEDLLAKAPGEV